MAKPKKRCRAVSPTHGLQCEKAKAHNKTEDFPLHQNGAIVWATHDGRVGSEVEMSVDAPPQLTEWAQRVFGEYFPPGHTVQFNITPLTAEDATKFKDRFLAAQAGPPEFADQRFGAGAEPTFIVVDELRQQELTAWWMAKATDEVERTVPKAVEYGSDDLTEIGRQMAAAMDWTDWANEEPTDAQLAELGVYFYIVGKLARWTSAIRRGDQVSDDTLFDIGVYVRMAQRIRHAGGWPGVAPVEDGEPTQRADHSFQRDLDAETRIVPNYNNRSAG